MTEELGKNIAGSGGSGCFKAGTLIQLQHGKATPIENLKVGDEVLSFDESGNIHVSTVTETHFHKSPEPLLRVNFWKGSVCITPNHWVLNQYGAFAEMGRMTTHDALVDGMGHLRPILSAEAIEAESVYNLTVEPNHTFIADGVRVHNGGHRARHPVIAGSGGGSSKGGGGAIEAPDSLRSKARISILDLIGEGQIGGLVNGAQSIFLNNTPAQNADGTWNFTRQIPSVNGSGATIYAPAPFSYAFRDGQQNQTSIPGFPDVETARNIGTVARHSQAAITVAVTNPNVDAVRLIVAVSALSEQNTTTGDVSGSSVAFSFSVSVNGGAMTPLSSTLVISGKTKSNYQRSYQYQLPKFATNGAAATSWSIALTRLSLDSVSSAIQNEIRFDSLVEIVNTKLSYPNSAIIGMSVDSEIFSSIPARSYLVKGLFIQVPSNYNAVTRAYTGVWDGTFIIAVSDNPAWVLYDLLTEPRYGLGQFIAPTLADKAKLYQIGRYCDELVPDGFGGTEPRFTINTAIQNLSEAYKLISDITSVFRGMAYWAGGMVGFTQDAPSTPTMMFTQSNVVSGVFTYTGASRRDRHSVVLVSWNDPKQLYRQVIEYVEDPLLIAKFGIRKSDVVAFGCTSRGQAHRLGKWILYTEDFESEVINFRVGLDSSLCLPGEVVKIQDADRAGKRMGGRLAACTLNSATLDAPLVLGAAVGGVMPTISLRMSDGTFVDRVILESAATVTTVTWTTALATLPVANGVWIMTESTLEPMLARVVGIAQADAPGEYNVTAVQHNPSKYAAIENNIALVAPTLTLIDTATVVMPSGMIITESPYLAAPGTNGIMLSVSWSGQANSYEVTWSRTGAFQANSVTQNVTSPVFDVLNALAGTYTFSVVAINMFGNRSQPLVQTFTTGAVMPPPAPLATLIATGGMMENSLAWTFSAPTLSGESIEIFSNSVNDPLTATRIAVLPPPTMAYVDRGHDIGMLIYYFARLINTSSQVSAWSAASATTIKNPTLLLAQLANSIDATQLSPTLGANFLAGNVNGVATLGLSGQMIVDGSITATSLAAGTVTADKINGTNLNVVNGTFTGTLAGADITGTTGTFGGLLAAGVVDITKLIGVTTVYPAGTYTLTVPADKTSMRLVLVSGGGGGGGGAGKAGFSTNSSGGGGGGGGNISSANFSGLTPGATYTLTVGSGGNGGAGGNVYANASGLLGSTGGATSVTGLLSATGGGGGGGGVSLSSTSAAGGTGRVAGGAGGSPANSYNGAAGSGTGAGAGGTKVASTCGGGGGGGGGIYGGSNASAGANATYTGLNSYGGGGGTSAGAGGGGGGAGVYYGGAGGNGAPGIASVEFFNPNGVVIRSEWNTLQAALTRQGIAII